MRSICVSALKRNVFIGVAVGLLIVAIAVGAFFLFRHILTLSPPSIFDENAVEGVPFAGEEEGWVAMPYPGIAYISVFVEPEIRDGRAMMYFTCHEASESYAMLTVYTVEFFMNEEGKMDYRPGKEIGGTKFLRQGEFVESIPLDLGKIAAASGQKVPLLIKISGRDEEGRSTGFFYNQAQIVMP